MDTIRASGEIEKLFRSGRRASNKLVVAIAAERDESRGPSGRVAFVAGKRLGPAVHRNRAKRRLREACAQAGGPWAGYDVLLVARAGTGAAAQSEVDTAVAAALRSAGILS